jgi:tetratricopeptide (TPR) repeat protein
MIPHVGTNVEKVRIVRARREVKLGQRIRVMFSVGVSFVLIWFLVQGYRHQHETDRQLAEMRKVIQASAVPVSGVRGDLAPNVHASGAVEGSSGQHDLEEILSRGWKLVDQRSPDLARKAVRVFNDGIANVDPSSPELYNGLGRALLVAGRPREAVTAWRKGLTLAPNYSDMQSGIGWAYWWLNDPYRAKDAWQRALAINPHSIDAWSAMAWIDLALGKNADAKSGFEELVKFDSGRKPWIMGLAMAQGHNADTRQISQLFPLPAPGTFDRPLPNDPAQVTAAEVGRP